MRTNTSLFAHELLCLRLKSFYGVQPGPPSPKGAAPRPTPKKVGSLFRSS